MGRRRRRSREHQVRAVATLKDGGRIVQTVRTKSVGYAERVDVDVVQVTVTVSDDRGRFVRDMPQSAFHVLEDGQPQAITHFASEDVPLELVVAIDISGSMAPAMPKLKTAVKEFLGAVPAQDQVTLLGFNDNIFTLTRKTTDPAERVKAVDRLAPWGSTALYDVILRGVEMLGRQTGRKALVVFTDGEDQGSHATIGDVERRLQSSDVTLYMIGQGRGVTLESLQKDHGAAGDARPAAARCSPTASTSCRTRSPSCSTSCRTSICSAISRPTRSATTRGGRSRSRSTVTTTSARGRAIARWRGNDERITATARKRAETRRAARALRVLRALRSTSWLAPRSSCAATATHRRPAAAAAELPVVGRSDVARRHGRRRSRQADRRPHAGRLHRARRRQPAPRRHRGMGAAVRACQRDAVAAAARRATARTKAPPAAG